MTAKLELKTASGGKVILDPTDTAVDRTLTLPAVAGTVLNDQSNIEAQVKTATNASGSAPIYACRAWVNFNGTGTVAIRASGNVSSITDNGTGDYTVNFTTAMPDADYSALVNSRRVATGALDIVADRSTSKATDLFTTSVKIFSVEPVATSDTKVALLDSALVSVAIFR
jgi:hypothetical protein